MAARPLQTTGELARIVRKALGHKPHDKKDPATRTFQAVRIHVNGELDELSAGLSAAESLARVALRKQLRDLVASGKRTRQDARKQYLKAFPTDRNNTPQYRIRPLPMVLTIRKTEAPRK